MSYIVPHFVETKQKVWGPFTFANFIILIGVGAVLGILWFLLNNFTIWLMIAIIIVPLTLVLMFVKINGQPITKMSIYFFKYLFLSKKYIWLGSSKKQSIDEFVNIKTFPKRIAQKESEEKVTSASVKKDIEQLSKMLDKE
ncbi:MAG: PrgI family protein [Patescibacteria group bacterium]